MKRALKNPNDHQAKTPRTKGRKQNDRLFTSYDTSKTETASPQKVRESRESAGEHARQKKAR